jgi:tetratricopeptide (TPR) repeat protein
MRRSFPLILAAMVAASPAAAQHERHGGRESLGRVSFPTSCAAAVQPDIDRAAAMLHSFWFDAAHKAFDKIAAADPTCAIAPWGIAMTLWGNPFVRQPIPAERQQAGLAAAERAAALASRATHREQMYIDAAAALWRDAAKLDHLAGLARHEQGMKALYEAHPEDSEAAMFYARAIIANAPPTDLEFKRQLYAASLLLAGQGAELEETVEKHPVTPGPLLPARELEGDLLMELGRPADALRSYERTLVREPRRARALFGAARAAERSGDRSAARAHYEQLSQLMEGADAARAEARIAREFLARRG